MHILLNLVTRRSDPTATLLKVWPWKLVWKVKISTKIASFSWLAIRESCSTRDNLAKRGIMLCSKWDICLQESENISLLSLHFQAARDIWSMFFNHFGVSWVMPYTTKRSICPLGSWKGYKTEIEKGYQHASFGVFGKKETLDIVILSLLDKLKVRCLISLFCCDLKV